MVSAQTVFSPTVISQAQVMQGMPLTQIGGKAAGLGRLLAAGAQVPPFFVLSPDWSPRTDSAALQEALTALGEGPWAVRSSAVAEDGASISFAGQLQTVLGLTTQVQVLSAVQSCRDSATSDTVRAYCKIHGIEPGPVAVIIQRMIVGEASGGAFSRDPQDPGFVLISAAWGLGEGVVQGQVNCDTYRVDPQGGMLGEVKLKPSAMRLVDGEIREVSVPEADQHIAVLDEAQIFELGLLCRSIEAEMDFPQHVEWTLSEGKLSLLQTRPITAPVPWGHRVLWDNSTIVESFSGTTTPLTFGFARNAYAIETQLFCRFMGVKEAVISERKNSFRHLIGLIQGRMYFNLNAWYRVVALLPGYRFNREAMERRMGVSEPADDKAAQDASWPERVWLTPKIIGLVVRILWRGTRRRADCERFEKEFEAAYRPWREADFNAMNPGELMLAYAGIERKLLWNWRAPLLNDWFAMIHHERLAQRCVDWVGEPEESEMAHSLLAGEGDSEGTAPTRDLLREAAESLAGQRLGGFKRWRFMKGVRKTRACVAKRESHRFLRTQVFALVRDIFRSLGEQMAAANTLRSPEDIFFLHPEEVWAWVDGSAVSVDLQNRVQTRKAEWATYEKDPDPPERFYTYGPVHRNNEFIGEHLEAYTDALSTQSLEKTP